MKYDPLSEFLNNCGEERIRLSFAQIESILSFDLPNSAKKYSAWWTNGNHTHSDAWLDAGYIVSEVSFANEYVVKSLRSLM